jgi:hypothetical protein
MYAHAVISTILHFSTAIIVILIAPLVTGRYQKTVRRALWVSCSLAVDACVRAVWLVHYWETVYTATYGAKAVQQRLSTVYHAMRALIVLSRLTTHVTVWRVI